MTTETLWTGEVFLGFGFWVFGKPAYLLCIVGELAGVGSVAVAVAFGVGDR